VTLTVEAPPLQFRLTPRIVAAVAHEEGLVLEAYRDSKNVWTVALGVAETGGYDVLRYKDKPMPIEEAVRLSVDAMRRDYLPDVQQAFDGQRLKEHEIAGALSFHWNTGAIRRASWVKAWCDGDIADARRRYNQWRKPPEIIPRRKRDAALFFDAVWPADTRVPIRRVAKPSYKPFGPKPFDILPMLEQIMGGV
jgi:lysozyme